MADEIEAKENEQTPDVITEGIVNWSWVQNIDEGDPWTEYLKE